jgi:hypothetical protein
MKKLQKMWYIIIIFYISSCGVVKHNEGLNLGTKKYFDLFDTDNSIISLPVIEISKQPIIYENLIESALQHYQNKDGQKGEFVRSYKMSNNLHYLMFESIYKDGEVVVYALDIQKRIFIYRFFVPFD